MSNAVSTAREHVLFNALRIPCGADRILAVCGEDEVFDVLQPFQVVVLNVAGQALGMLVHPPILSRQVKTVIFVRDLELLRFEDTLDLLTSLGVNILGMLLDLAGGFHSMRIGMSDSVRTCLNVSRLVELIREDRLDF